ncbi:stalk domain-containing protein [Paenibacillus montanisoli]|uniref:Glycosyl hydrolase family 98 putative carbohydrate-binding module domain-containing protein n=1 Tax=Paenibacillus montanisoli TaxID=2081970 RepID=A0A328U321_9BACL|nr:stalk domain-containing protein [Paenibacillus montanisoli]RAP74374.1 hypothetical protein DL346_20040 [Paenibacillus montanisoli]
MLKKSRQFIAGVLVGATLFGGTTVLAANKTILEITTLPLKYFFDGLQINPPEDQQGFVYKGTTYVPLRFVSESLGEKVTWEGKTSSIYVGKMPEGKLTYLTDLQPHSTSGSFNTLIKDSGNFTTIMNQTYSKSMQLNTYNPASGEYLLDGQYKRFQAGLMPDSYWKGKNSEKLGIIKIYGDGEVLYSSPTISSNASEIENIDIDVTRVLKLSIEFDPYITSPYIDFIQPRFIQ